MHSSSRSPWPTYFAALLLGALLGLLLIAPAHAAVRLSSAATGALATPSVISD